MPSARTEQPVHNGIAAGATRLKRTADRCSAAHRTAASCRCRIKVVGLFQRATTGMLTLLGTMVRLMEPEFKTAPNLFTSNLVVLRVVMGLGTGNLLCS